MPSSSTSLPSWAAVTSGEALQAVSHRQGVPLLEEVPRSHILPHTPHTHREATLSFSVSCSALTERQGCEWKKDEVCYGFTSASEVNHSYSMNTHRLYIDLEMYGGDWLWCNIQYIHHHDSIFKQRAVPWSQVVINQYIGYFFNKYGVKWKCSINSIFVCGFVYFLVCSTFSSFYNWSFFSQTLDHNLHIPYYTKYIIFTRFFKILIIYNLIQLGGITLIKS